jgi:hypothetical protein
MGQDELQPGYKSVRLGGEAYEDDVEGHGAKKAYAIEPEDVQGRTPRAVDDDGDVEGHGAKKAYAIDPEDVQGRTPRAVDDEDDVEGHASRSAARAFEPEGIKVPRAADDDEGDAYIKTPR